MASRRIFADRLLLLLFIYFGIYSWQGVLGLLGLSRLQAASRPGQWSRWEFKSSPAYKMIFVGNCWRKPPRIYYHGESHPLGYVGLGKEMHIARAPGKMPNETVAHRYTNLRVEVLE